MNTHNQEIVTQVFHAWETGDRALLGTLLADTFTFTSPNDYALSREAYWDICWANREGITGFDLLTIIATDVDAFVRYNGTLKNGRVFQNAEYMTMADGQVTSVTVYFGRTLIEQSG